MTEQPTGETVTTETTYVVEFKTEYSDWSPIFVQFSNVWNAVWFKAQEDKRRPHIPHRIKKTTKITEILG